MKTIEEIGYTWISGATGGIGSAFALECLKGGALFLTGRDEQKLSALKEELLKVSPKAVIEIFACDLSDENQREEMYRFAEQNGILIGRLCCVAGIDTQKAFDRYSQDKLVNQTRTNFEAAVSMTLFALNHRADHLDIAVVSSICGTYPMPYFALYSATKGALTSFFLSLHTELKKSSVHVTIVAPNGVYTRQDVCEYIRKEGVWGRLSAKQPEYIVIKTLKALQKNKRIIYPGFWNKIAAFVPKLVPSCLRMRIIAKRWSKTEKDAF